MSTISERLFDGTNAESELEELLNFPFERLGWDYYDCSLEIHGVEPDFRLDQSAIEVVKSAGFAKVYVNHTDKWETHYAQPMWEPWRVSYPHKRQDGNASILVEQFPPKWPKEWNDTGYAKVVNA